MLKTHPINQVRSKYFLFFSKAYKIIYGIYSFIVPNIRDHEKYKTLDHENNNEIIKKALSSRTVKKDFNKWFNELFEKAKIEDEYNSHGYEEWLKSEEDLDNFSNLNKKEQDEKLEEKRNKIKSLIKVNEINDIQSEGYNLLRENQIIIQGYF